MKLHLLVDETGHVYGYDEEGIMGKEYEVPDTFKEEFSPHYKIVNGKLGKMSDEELKVSYPEFCINNKLVEQRNKFEDIQQQLLLQTLSDEQALKFDMLYQEWDVNQLYSTGFIVRYKDRLYRCLQSHTSIETWTPTDAVSLWVEISDPAEKYPEFKQPNGPYDAYMSGDKVTYKDKHYESLVDYNVYSPEDYPSNWKEVE